MHPSTVSHVTSAVESQDQFPLTGEVGVLSARLGAPDVFTVPQDCSKPSLTVLQQSYRDSFEAENLENGYTESFSSQGIPLAKELHLTLTNAVVGRADIADRLLKASTAALHSAASAQKSRLAASHQKHDLPSTQEIAPKPEAIPELHHMPPDARERWLRELAGSCPLRQLEDSVPQGLLRTALFEALWRHRVHCLRAGWLIRVVYLNQVRPGAEGGEHSQRCELWTRHVLEHLEAQLPRIAESLQPQPRGKEVGARGSATMEHDPFTIGLSLLFGRQVGDEWLYLLKLLGSTYREGLVDAAALLTWLTRLLRPPDPSGAATLALLPILQLCLQDVASSQLHTRNIASLAEARLNSLPPAAANPLVPQLLSTAFSHILHSLMAITPHTFVAMDTTPGGDVLCRDREDASAAAARDLAAEVSRRRAALAASVQVRVLCYSEADAAKVLEEGMRGSSAESSLKELKTLLETGNAVTALQAELVKVICGWACSTPRLNVPLVAQALEDSRAVLEVRCGSKQLFALTILKALAAEQPTTFTAGPKLQTAIFSWLEEQGSGGGSVTWLEGRQAADLLVQVACAGLFCPGEYLHKLVAWGLAPTPARALAATQARAALHMRFLAHLHPHMHLPTLADVPSPRTPGADEEPSKELRSHQHEHYASVRARILTGFGGQDAGCGTGQGLKRSASDFQGMDDAASGPTSSHDARETKKAKTCEASPAPTPTLNRRVASLKRTPSLQPQSSTVDTGSLASSAATLSSVPSQAEQLRCLRTVQALTEELITGEGSGSGALSKTNASELLLSVAKMRPWEQQCFSRWLADWLQNHLLQEDSELEAVGRQAWLMGAVAPLEAAGGQAGALQLLLKLLEKLTTCRVAALQHGAADLPWQVAGVGEAALLALIAARLPALMATGLCTRALEITILWALQQPTLSEDTARPAFQRVIDLTHSLLRSCRGRSEVMRWWEGTQRLHRSHWLVKSLEAVMREAPGPSQPARIAVPCCKAPTAQRLASLSKAAAELSPPTDICASLCRNPTQQQAKILTDHLCEYVLPSQPDKACHSRLAALISCLVASLGAPLSPGAARDDAREDAGKPPLQRNPSIGQSPSCQRAASAGTPLQTAAAVETNLAILGLLCSQLTQRGLSDAAAAVEAGILAACSQEQQETASDFLVSAIAAGLVDLEHACQALLPSATLEPSRWVTILLGPEWCGLGSESALGSTLRGVGIATQFQLLQRSLPWSLLYQYAGLRISDATLHIMSEQGDAQTVVSALACHQPIQQGLLGRLQELEKSLAHNGQRLRALPQPATALPELLVMHSLLLGRLEAMPQGASIADRQEASEASLASLLALATPAAHPLLRLLLRMHLNEQVYLAALRRGLANYDAYKVVEKVLHSRSEVLSPQALARTPSQITEEEKTFTSRVLAQLLPTPRAGATLAGLTWDLGKGCGEYLLQQVDWVLQDTDTLLGHQYLAHVLQRRFGSLLPPEPPAQDAKPAGISLCSAFAVEQGLADVALTCLARSQAQRQREFAEQLVMQLKRLGEVLRTPLPEAEPSGRVSGLSQADSEAEGPARGKSGTTAAGAAFGAARARRMGLKISLSPGPSEGVQLAVWLRLAILPSLLPRIYADRETDPAKNLRHLLAPALLALLTSPAIYSDAPRAAFAGLASLVGAEARILSPPSRLSKGGEAEPGEGGEAAVGIPAGAAASAACKQAGEPLTDRLAEVLHALLAGSWASWLRGDKTKLREVPMFVSRQLQQDLDSCELPPTVRALIQAALPSLPSHRFTAQGHNESRQGIQSRAAKLSSEAGNPWALPTEEQMTGLVARDCSRVSPLLEGAVRVQRRPFL